METSSTNNDTFRGSPRRNSSILSASNLIQAPISTLLEYSGLFRPRTTSPTHEAETLLSSDDSPGINSNGGGGGEVAIRIIGNAEQDEVAESDITGAAQTTEVPGSSSASPVGGGTGEGGESVGGDAAAASRDSPYQRYDIQQAARWIEQILPFSLLLLVVFIRQHLQGTLLTPLIYCLCFYIIFWFAYNVSFS